MSNNDSHVTENNECADWGMEVFPPTHLKIYQYSGASYKKKKFLLITQAMECAGILLTQHSVQSYTASA